MTISINDLRRFQLLWGIVVTIMVSRCNRLPGGNMLTFAMTLALQNPVRTTIKVCQNKHCCKRASKNVDILQTMNNLLLTAPQNSLHVKGSSCLSHCDMGPNVEILLPNGTSLLLHGMMDAQMCAAQLGLLLLKNEEANQDDKMLSILSPPKILLAASKVMEQSQTLPIAERIRYLTSVITKLEESKQQSTAANAHAHALRAQAYLDEDNHRNNNTSRSISLDHAIQDARYVVRDLQRDAVATTTTLALAFRTWVDAELQKGQTQHALDVLQEWYHVQPTYRTKLQREIQEVLMENTS
jgi:hypothetical protein